MHAGGLLQAQGVNGIGYHAYGGKAVGQGRGRKHGGRMVGQETVVSAGVVEGLGN